VGTKGRVSNTRVLLAGHQL